MVGRIRHDGMSLPPRRNPPKAQGSLGSVAQTTQASEAGLGWERLSITAMRRWATGHGIDLGDLTRKVDIVAALTAATGSATVPEGD